MHIKILVPDSAPGHALSVPPSSTHKHTHLIISWWCTHKPTRWRRSIHESEWGSYATERYRESLLEGVADGVFHACVCARMSPVRCATGFARVFSRIARPPNTRDTRCTRYALSPPVAALCGTTRPPWFHSWLHWLIFARCPRTLERRCTYVPYGARPSTSIVKVEAGCKERTWEI